MKTSRADIFFTCVLSLGLVACLFPMTVWIPASAFWQAATGKLDMFEVYPLVTWLAVLIASSIVSVGRSIHLIKARSGWNRSDLAFKLLSLFLTISTGYAVWRPFHAIDLLPWNF